MAAAWVIVGVLGDRVWWALPLLFGPRWTAGILLLGLVPAMITHRRTAVRAGVPMLAIYAFGLLDVRVGLGRLEPAETVTLRVMELNAAAGSSAPGTASDAVREEIARVGAEIVIVAECSPALAAALASDPAWRVRQAVTSLCLATRFPIRSWEERDPRDFWERGGAGAIARATVETPAGAVRIGLVHLETPRGALDNFADLSSIPTLGPLTRANMAERDLESRAAREWIFSGESLPTIVAGDFNLPIESAIYRRRWSGLRNSFSRSGTGLGNTKQTRFWGVRIDHILTTAEFVSHHARIGRDVGSDHRPLSAELSLPVAQRTSVAR